MEDERKEKMETEQPGYSGPYPPPGYAYYPPYPYPPQQQLGPLRRKRFSIIELLVIILVLFVFVAPLIFSFSLFMSGPTTIPYEKVMESAYYIKNGTYIGEKVEVWSNVDIRVSVNVSMDKKVDVFIMTESQYELFGNSSDAFGYVYADKNISSCEFTTNIGETCYIVIDNSDIAMLNDDALPHGMVDVQLKIDKRYPYTFD